MENVVFISITQEEFKKFIAIAVQDGVSSIMAKVSDSQPENDIITRKEAAEILGISLPTLGKWTKEGLVPAHRISSRVRYKRSEVIKSLNAIKSVKR